MPALLALISIAGRRWGPGIAGWLAGFPSLTGPILLFLALERGTEFAAHAAVTSLASVFCAVSFGITYAWACRRLHWFWSWLCALASWTLAGTLLNQVSLSELGALVVALLTLFAAPRLFPRAQAQWGGHVLPAQELLLRMAAGAAMVLTVTAVAEAVGPAWTGLIAAFPVMSTVLAVFSHRANGPGFVVALLRSMIGGFYSFIAYCLSVALLLEHWGVAATFVLAVTAAVAVQGAARAVMLRLA